MITPQTEEDFKQILTPEGMRWRIQDNVDTNEVVKAIFARADINKLTPLDRYTLLAFHALTIIESLKKNPPIKAG
jgi:hypothetical protein